MDSKLEFCFVFVTFKDSNDPSDYMKQIYILPRSACLASLQVYTIVAIIWTLSPPNHIGSTLILLAIWSSPGFMCVGH